MLKSENIIQNKKREGIPIHHKAMCVEKGANPNIIPCIISSGLLNSYTSLFPIIMHIYIVLYANDKTLLVVHFKTIIRIKN